MAREKQEHELIHIAEAARRYNLDRLTVRKRLYGIEPVGFGKKGEKLYDLDEVEPLLTAEGEQAADAVKLRKLTAEAERQELLTAKMRGELVDVGVVRSMVYDFFKQARQLIVVEFPRANGPQIAQMKDSRETITFLNRELAQIFDELSESDILSERGLPVSDPDECADGEPMGGEV